MNYFCVFLWNNGSCTPSSHSLNFGYNSRLFAMKLLSYLHLCTCDWLRDFAFLIKINGWNSYLSLRLISSGRTGKIHLTLGEPGSKGTLRPGTYLWPQDFPSHWWQRWDSLSRLSNERTDRGCRRRDIQDQTKSSGSDVWLPNPSGLDEIGDRRDVLK